MDLSHYFIKMVSLNGETLITEVFYMDYQQNGIFLVRKSEKDILITAILRVFGFGGILMVN